MNQNVADIHNLRKELTRVNQEHGYDQESSMEDLRGWMDHSCELHELGPDNVDEDFCAFAYCLDLYKNPEIMKNKERIFSNHGWNNKDRHKWEYCWQAFHGVAFHYMKQIDANEAQEGDVVFYLAEPATELRDMEALHAGKVHMGKIASKWGRGKEESSTNVWLHDVEHVPDTYEDSNGNITIAYFRPEKEEILKYFLRSIPRKKAVRSA